jgi:hypothetical protein
MLLPSDMAAPLSVAACPPVNAVQVPLPRSTPTPAANQEEGAPPAVTVDGSAGGDVVAAALKKTRMRIKVSGRMALRCAERTPVRRPAARGGGAREVSAS